MQDLPLFPLNTVLFPHMPLALHIFEERYRVMMRDCEERGVGFGVVSIAEGREVGATAQPHRIGTLAQMQEVERLDDGRYNIVVAGASRFRVDELSFSKPYLLGDVTLLQDSVGDTQRIPQLAGRVRHAYREYVIRLRHLSEDDAVELELPDDPELLSYLVAAGLQVEVPARVRLLEEDAVSGRLEHELRLLRRENIFLEQMLTRGENLLGSVSLN